MKWKSYLKTPPSKVDLPILIGLKIGESDTNYRIIVKPIFTMIELRSLICTYGSCKDGKFYRYDFPWSRFEDYENFNDLVWPKE